MFVRIYVERYPILDLEVGVWIDCSPDEDVPEYTGFVLESVGKWNRGDRVYLTYEEREQSLRELSHAISN